MQTVEECRDSLVAGQTIRGGVGYKSSGGEEREGPAPARAPATRTTLGRVGEVGLRCDS